MAYLLLLPPAWLAHHLPSLLLSGTILFVLVALALHYLLPFTLRTWFLPRDFKIGHFSLSAVHHLAWEPEAGSRLAGIKVTVGSVGFVRWRGGGGRGSNGGGGGGAGIKEGLRNAGRKMMKATDRDKDRAWFLLRCQDVRVSVSQEALERLLSSSTKNTTTTTTGDDDTCDTAEKTKAAGTTPPRRARLPPADRVPTSSALLPLFPQLAPKWQRLLVYFAVQLSFLVQVEEVAQLEGTVCAGAEIAHQPRGRRSGGSGSSRGREDGGVEAEEEEEEGRGADEPEAKAWMRLSRIKIAPADVVADAAASAAVGGSKPSRPDRPSPTDDTEQPAAVEMLDPLVIRLAAPLVAVSPRTQPESAATTTTTTTTSSSSSQSPPSPSPPPTPAPATSPRWSLRRGGVRIAIEFGGEGGPPLAAGRGGGDNETLLVGLAAQAAAAAAEKKEQARRRLEDEKRVRGGGGPGGVGLGRVARTVDAGVHVRVQELEAIIARLKNVAAGAAHKKRPPAPPGGRQSRSTQEGETAQVEEEAPQQEATSEEKEREKGSRWQRPSPLIYLDSITFELPSFLLTAQHTIPSAVLSSDSGSAATPARETSPLSGSANHRNQHHLPKEIAFAVLVRDVKAHVEINRSTRDVRKEHRDWFGRERQISWRIGAEWREIEGRVKLDGGEEDALRGGGKALSISASRIDLTSTWIPPFLVPYSDFSPLSAARDQGPSRNIRQHHNDSIVLIEVFLGEVRGQALFETVDAAIRIFKARSRAASASASASAPGRPDPSTENDVEDGNAAEEPATTGDEGRKERLVRGLPQLVGAAVTAGMELRIQAPRHHHHNDGISQEKPADPTTSSDDSDDSDADPFADAGDPTDPFFRSWAAPEILCLSFPSGQISFGGEYRDRSVRRSEMDRRAAKRAAKQKRQNSAASKSGSRTNQQHTDDEEHYQSPTKALEEELGIPPPPPLKNDYTKRRITPEQPPTNMLKDLDRYGLEYHARFSLTTDTLNAYILTSRDDRHGAESPETSSGDSESDSDLPRLPSDPLRFDILAAGPLEVQSKFALLGDESVTATHPHLDLSTCKGRHSFLLETVQIDLWRPVVMSCIRDLLASLSGASPGSGASSPDPNPKPASEDKKPLVDRLPTDQKVHVALASFDMRVAGTDPKADPHSCRGVAVHSGPLVLQYILPSAHEPLAANDCAARSTLELAEDIHLEANALINAASSSSDERPRIALVKVDLSELEIDPVVDARASRGRKRYPQRRGDGHGEEVDRGWETRGRAELVGISDRRHYIVPPRFSPAQTSSEEEKQAGRGLVVLPHLALRARLQKAPASEDPAAPIDEVILHIETPSIELRLELFSIYLCLNAFSSIRRLHTSPTSSSREPKPPKQTSSPRPKPLTTVRGECRDLHIWPTLPHDTHLFMNFRRVRVQQDRADGLLVAWDKGMLAGQSPTLPGLWEDIIRIRAGKLRMRPDPSNHGYYPFVLSLDCETARLRIPFRYIFSRIIDNTASLVKATKQLVYEHVKGGQGIIIEPHAEDPKHLPQIELRIGLFAVELQDDPFETKLNIIWRAGAEEQASRLDREAAFAAKADAIRKAESGEGAEDSDSDSDADDRRSRRQPKIDARHSVGVEEARRNLLEYNSSSWITRVRNATAEQSRREDVLARKLYGADDHTMRVRAHLPINLAPVPRSAPLARATFHGLQLVVSKPSFGDEGLRDYLHEVGGGIPRDSTFSLLIPVHLSWKMEEARFQVRDYPLPLLHVPRGEGHQQHSWVAETDLVIAEETSGPQSVRRVPCAIIPQHVFKGQGAPYTIVVPRSAMPTKTYMRPTITIRSAEPVRIGWGNSIQPAISDVAHILETFTKNPPDPSPRMGFWDKIRLQFHWQLRFVFPGPRANVFFHLKGSRSPYALTGFGAGFAKAWKGNIQFRLGLPNPDHEFFQIISDEYVLGIPNLRAYVDTAATGNYFTDASADPSSPDNHSAYAASTIADDPYDPSVEDERDDDTGALWIKVCAKCNNGVRWGMGIVLERTCRDADCRDAGCYKLGTFHRRCRMFDFVPHWHVHTKTADSIGPHGEIDDSYAGFRSDFVHFSLSLTSPCNLSLPNRPETRLEDEKAGSPNKKGFNSFHFTPVALVHFRRWWKLFDGCMSLPIRQGKLFPSAQPPSPKFGRHTATIKYRFALAPLFISHTYRQHDWEEWRNGETSVLGLKGKIGRFNVDLHQRAQEMVIRRPEMSESKHVTHKVFYMAEVDVDSVDLRAIMAVFDEPEKAEFAPAEVGDADEEAAPKPDFDEFLVTEEEREWVNVDDFKDSVGSWPFAGEPRIHLLPFMMCPRFTYYRHKEAGAPPTDEREAGASDSPATPPDRPASKFGDEASHTCLMGSAEDTILVQIRGAQLRLEDLEAQLADADRGPRRDEIELRIRAIRRIIVRLEEVRHNTQPNLDRSAATDHQHARPEATPTSNAIDEDLGGPASLPHITSALFEEWGQWENRYMIHSPLVHVSNATREILLKYYYSSRERKGLMYYASASVLKFLRDMAQKRDAKLRHGSSRRKTTGGSSFFGPGQTPGVDNCATEQANRLLDELLDHVGDGVAANEEEEEEDGDRHRFGDHLLIDPEAAQDALPDAFESSPKHLCMFIQPQVSLQSNVDDKSNLIISAFRAQVKVYQVTDTRIVDDPVNSDVLHQTFARLDGLQVFYPRTQLSVGVRKRDRAFVPLETLIDLRVEPWGFDRVVSRSSAALRYDKFNQLRLGSKRSLREDSVGAGPKLESHFHTSTDRVSFECQKISLSANPEHFAAIYNVTTDLILYSDPRRKSQNSKTEALVFTRDFSHIREVLETVASLQERLRNHAYLEQEFQVHLDELDDQGMVELLLTRVEFLRIAQELRLVVEAFTRAQDLQGKKRTTKRSGLQLEARAAELTWHMLDKDDLPFAKFSVLGAEFSWISTHDGSATNRMVIRDLRALNSSPDQIFAEIVSKADNIGEDHPLAKVDVFGAAIWNSLAPVGGIAIIERFELHLHPIRVQLEHRVGKKILDYVFSERQQQRAHREENGRRGGGHDGDDDDASSVRSRTARSTNSPASRSVDSLPLSPNQGQFSLRSAGSSDLLSSRASILSQEERLRRATAPDSLTSQPQEEGLDADEMRRRARTNRTFIFAEISSTLLCLTYRSEKEDKSSLPNIYNVTYSTPLIRFRSKTWSYLDLLNDVKRDMIRSVWQQKGQLIGQFLSKTHRRLPMADTRSAAKQAVQASFRNRIKSMKARSGTGAGLVSPQEGVATEVAIAPTAKSNDPLVRYHASTYRDSLNGQGPASKSPLDLPPADADEPKLRDEDLPFDLSAVNLINPQVEYHDDDDEESMTYPQARAQADARLGSVVVTGTPVVEEPESIAADDESESSRERGARSSVGGGGSHSHSGSSARPTESSPIGSDTSASSPLRASFGSHQQPPRAAAVPERMRLSSQASTRSTRSTKSTSSSIRSAGLPAPPPSHGHVARHGPANLSDEQKARLLLGRSLD